MFEQTFKNIDNELRKDAGCSSELDYIEQTSRILFLKNLESIYQQILAYLKELKQSILQKAFEEVL